MGEGMKCCLLGTTMVAMLDGSSRRIEDIQIGDMILGEHDCACVVKNVFCGYEEQLMKITLENNKKITCTANHIFVSKAGIRRAEQLREGNLLETLDESGKVVHIERVDGGQVINLELKEAHFYYAEEILTGDFCIQNEHERDDVCQKQE